MKLKWLGKILPAPNGCGPEGFQHLVPNWIFKPACNLHDNLFQIKPGFFKSNSEFYHRMRWCIYVCSRPFYKILFYEFVAILYWFMVTIFGWTYYFEIKRKAIKYCKRLFNIK